jgi:DNA-binding MarR family transcriptional regulator
MDTSHLYQDSIGRLVQLTSNTLTRYFHKQLEVCDITVEQFGVINNLHKDSGTTLGALAQKVNKDHTNLSRIVAKLERKGLIARITPPHDKRACMIFLTKSGEQVKGEAIKIAEKKIEKYLADISIEEQQLLRKLLLKICSNTEA